MQGYDLLWYKSFGGQGYQTPDMTKILQSENTDYHMNTVVIPVGATVDSSSLTTINFDPNGTNDTYSDAVYTTLVNQARAAKEMPFLNWCFTGQEQYLIPGQARLANHGMETLDRL